VTQFVLNGDFTNVRAFALDQDGDGDKEIGIGGIEIKGLLRGPAYQIFESNGTLVQTIFVLNPDFYQATEKDSYASLRSIASLQRTG
jgi:hypothetical protein